MSSPLSILVLAPQPFFQDRGTPIAVKLLVEELARLGHEVHLLVFHEGEDIAIEGVHLHRTAKLPGVRGIPPSLSWKKLVCDGAMFFSLLALQFRYRFDVIHCVEESVFLALFSKPLIRRPYVYDMDSSLAIQVADKVKVLKVLRPVLEFFEGAAVRGSLGVVAVCKALEDIARDYAPEKEVITLEDISLLDEEARGEEDLRSTLELAEPVMLYVGNLERYQGIDLLLEAFSLAVAEGAVGSVVIIGGNPQSIESYRGKAAQLGLSERVHFCGPRPLALLSYYLKQADILLSPRIEGNNTPMKLYSYLDSGRAVLATRLPTHTQVLDEGVSCLVEPTPGSMAQGMIKLAEDRDHCLELGKRGRELAQERYSLTAYRQKLDAFYGTLAGTISGAGKAPQGRKQS